MDQPTELLRELNRSVPCHAATIFSDNNIWHGTNPMVQILPLFIFQLTLVIFTTRFFILVFKPFQQPRFIAEIVGGILLGPSALGRYRKFSNKFFPPAGFRVLDSMAHFALIYYAFLVGLEMDLSSVSRTGKKALIVAVAGIIFPFGLGFCFYLLFYFDGKSPKLGFLFWSIALSVTGCSELAQLLEKLKILQTEIAKTVLSSAQIDELCSWVFLAAAIPIYSSFYTTHWALLSTAAFVLFSIYYLRPALMWIMRRMPQGQGYSEHYISCILVGVALCGVLTDACGTHPIIGAFVFGLVIPNGVLEATLVERLEEFVSGFLMPVFFVVCGLRTDVDQITSTSTTDKASSPIVALIIAAACLVKFVGTLFISSFCHIPVKEAMSLGLLMNTKSLFAMVVLYTGLEQTALNIQTYTIMVIAVLLMTMIVMPIMTLNQPRGKAIPYKRRTIQKSKPHEELRILACVHVTRNVPVIINLLEASNATRESPIIVFALHLLELIGRASAMLTVHNTRKSGSKNPSHAQAQSDQIITAFEQYERRCGAASVHPLIARCPYSTMDEDICSVAEDKRASLIIIPFHKQQTLDGKMEDINPAIRDVNENVLASAPCSVGILIDRGLAESGDFTRRVAVLYFGGPDDREALSYALRMAKHPDMSLTVVRFLPSEDAANMEAMDFWGRTHGVVTVNIDTERERELDDDFLNKFKIMTVNDLSISYKELVLDDEEQTVTAIKSMDQEFDLYVVGKGRGVVSPLTVGLEDWCDCPELGAIGDVLVSSEFTSAFSVLVVQQYVRTAVKGEGSVTTISTKEEFIPMDWQPHAADDDGSESFVYPREKDIDDDDY
uniref:Putative cation/H(+) antiporter 15-like n=1 Tax=Davidia involucrata TaxID=16924 RepID=A0A5B7BA09_DAVIN